MPELSTETVLKEEAAAIHGADVSGATNTQELYNRLNALNRSALCLSGGGIRSASFALGIIQALAAHPRSPDGAPVAKAEDSLLAEFQYLSTVSGGGYIGSWLSAWTTRTSFVNVWKNLVGRPDGPDAEPQVISWLRENSNYLTPKLGITSADSWTAAALYLRNLLLNWLVILPVLCFALVLLKLIAALTAELWRLPDDVWLPFAGIALAGALSLMISLRFTTRHRPTRWTDQATQTTFLTCDLIWAVIAAWAFSLCLVSSAVEISLSVRPKTS